MKAREWKIWLVVAVVSLTCGCAGVDHQQSNARFLRDVVAGDGSYERGELSVARRHYQRALAVRADFVPALIRLGMIEYREGNLDAATMHFSAAAGHDPRNSEAPYHLVLIYLAEARAQMEKYLELKPDADNRRSAEELMAAIARFTPG